MAIITRVYAWDGQYYLDWNQLPLSGLKALRFELEMMQAREGIMFSEVSLLRSIIKAIQTAS